MRRLVVSSSFLMLIAVILIATFIIYIPIYAKMQKGRAHGAFFQKSPDAIAVFTGDKGRIAYAMELVKRNPTTKLFISGVHGANSFQTILKNQSSNPMTAKTLAQPYVQVDLDYESKNTYENVRETIQYLKSNPDLKKILIISSDYHIMRVKLILSHFISNSKQEFYFDSVSGNYGSWKQTKKLLLEALKITRTFIQLKVFRGEIVKEDF